MSSETSSGASVTFECAVCETPAGEVVMRFCAPCKRSYLAGYVCLEDDCGHEDIDPPGKEWGHDAHASGDSGPST